MFEDRLIESGSVTSDAHGFSFGLRLNWYRALPLSSVARVDVVVDGDAIDPDAISFTVDGVTRRLRDLPGHPDDWWFVTDTAIVRVDRPGGLSPGEHALSVTLGSRIPYVVLRPPDVLVTMDTCRTTVTV